MNFFRFAPVLLVGLSACSMPSLPNLESLTSPSKPKTMESATGSGVKQDPMRLDTIAFADAYCRRDGAAAVAATQKLVVAHPNHPRALLNYGLSLDLAGRGVMAYLVLGRLSKGNHPMPSVLRCGADFMYSGTVTEVAQRRLFEIKTKLSALGVALPPPSSPTLKSDGDAIYRLAAMAPPADEVLAFSTKAKPPKPTPSKTYKAKAKPRKAAKGRHFVHLGSYKTTRNLDRGWRSLRKRFGKILGTQAKSVSKVNLGKKKGQYLRLGVTVANAKSARALCKRLKAGGQYCVVRRARKS